MFRIQILHSNFVTKITKFHLQKKNCNYKKKNASSNNSSEISFSVLFLNSELKYKHIITLKKVQIFTILNSFAQLYSQKFNACIVSHHRHSIHHSIFARFFGVIILWIHLVSINNNSNKSLSKQNRTTEI